MDIRDDSEVAAEQQRFALRDVEFRRVVGYAVLQTRIVGSDFASITGYIKTEKIAARESSSRRADKQVAVVLRSQCAAVHKSDRRGRYSIFPTEYGIFEM